MFFCPKLAFLGLFWAKNGHFLGGAALNHPFSRFLTLQHMLFFCGAPAKYGGGVLNGPPEPKKHCFWPKNSIFRPFLGKKWPFFGQKMAIFRGGGALHHPVPCQTVQRPPARMCDQ